MIASIVRHARRPYRRIPDVGPGSARRAVIWPRCAVRTQVQAFLAAEVIGDRRHLRAGRIGDAARPDRVHPVRPNRSIAASISLATGDEICHTPLVRLNELVKRHV